MQAKPTPADAADAGAGDLSLLAGADVARMAEATSRAESSAAASCVPSQAEGRLINARSAVRCFEVALDHGDRGRRWLVSERDTGDDVAASTEAR